MTLSDSYIDYLKKRGGAAGTVLSQELHKAGYELESVLLARFTQFGPGETVIDMGISPWSGRRAWTGPYLPNERYAGEIWFDTLELMPMLLIPDEPLPEGEDISPELLARYTPYRGWLAMRPVANWQFNAFLRLAKTGPRAVQISPSFPLLDTKRIIQGRETDPVMNITGGEARMYAHWLGKGMPDQYEWQMAARYLSFEELEALWGGQHREWAGSYDEGNYLVISPDTIEADPEDDYSSEGRTGDRPKMIYGEWELPKKVTFRTYALAQTGLFGGVFTIPTSLDNVELLDVLERDV